MKSILAMGELLWDELGTQKKAAGAPFNFAREAYHHGLFSIFISAVGRDKAGDALANAALASGIQVELQRNNLSTGVARISSCHGQNRFELANPAAWDEIQRTPELEQLEARSDALYFGTLAQRSAISRNTIRTLVQAFRGRKRFCDINLRPPYDEAQTVLWSLKNCDILKISEEEAPRISQFLGCDTENIAQSCFDASGIEIIVETLGAHGAQCFMRNNTPVFVPAPEVRAISTVGAGDAFLAAFASRLLSDKSAAEATQYAVKQAASFVCRP